MFGYNIDKKTLYNTRLLIFNSLNISLCPSESTNKEPYKEIKNSLHNSAIISLPLTTITKNQLPSIIDYITQKGYTFEKLDILLSESIEK